MPVLSSIQETISSITPSSRASHYSFDDSGFANNKQSPYSTGNNYSPIITCNTQDNKSSTPNHMNVRGISDNDIWKYKNQQALSTRQMDVLKQQSQQQINQWENDNHQICSVYSNNILDDIKFENRQAEIDVLQNQFKPDDPGGINHYLMEIENNQENNYNRKITNSVCN